MLKRGGSDIGNFLGGASNGNTSISLNAAATFLAFGFVASESKTLTEIRLFLDAITGTVTAANIRADIYSDNGGTPNATLANTTASGNTPATWITFTFSLALTAGVMYWVVLRNLAGTPASNFPAFKFMDVQQRYATGTSTNSRFGWLKAQSTDSGGTWAGTRAMGIIGSPRVKYSDGTVEGFPSSSVTILSSENIIYSGRKRGVLYTPELGVALQVTGAVFMVGKNATAPTGNLEVEIYDHSSGTLLATSATVANANAVSSVGSSTLTFSFTSPVYLVGGKQYRIAVAETTQSDTSANYYSMYHFVKDTDSGSVPLYVDDGVVYYDGTSWSTDTTIGLCYWGLILDTLNRDFAIGRPSGLIQGTIR